MTKEQIQAATPEQILPKIFRDLLSQEAIKVYVSVWYRGAPKDFNVQVIDDADMVSRTRLPAYKVQRAIDELVHTGLLKFDKLHDCARFELLPLPDLGAEQSDQQIWAHYTESAL